MSGEFFPSQVIYEGKTERYSSKYIFTDNFDITFTVNHWSNTEKSIGFLKKILFPHFKNAHRVKGYQGEQMGLIIMDTFEGQSINEIAKFCHENSSAEAEVSLNLSSQAPLHTKLILEM